MQTEVMTIAIRANAWVNAVLALTVNLASSVLFYILGMHVALAVDRCVGMGWWIEGQPGMCGFSSVTCGFG